MDNEQIPAQEEVKDIRFKAPTFIDPLTELFNQYYLYQFLPEEIQKAKLSGYPLSIFIMDLDGFKAVNDTYGHLCGDEILKQLAVILKKFVRQTDMVIRYAGDEFVILLPAADQAKAEILANQLTEEVNKNIFKGKDNQDIHLTISTGLATYPNDATQMDKLIDLADKALYLSKQKGKNRVSLAKEVTLEVASYLIAMDSFPCPRFVDRKSEIDRLKQLFDAIVLKSNLLQVAFISGDSGIGKTRLLNEFNNYVREQAALIHCRGSSNHIQDPYYLFAKGISNYIDKIGIDNAEIHNLFSQLPLEELTELSRLIPAIAYLLKRPLDSERSDKDVRFFLFKSFLDFLIELNKRQAVVVSFDDIHWADKASLELLRYLSKQEKNKRIFIFCSFVEDRSKETIKDSDFREILEDIRFNDNFTHIKLSDFSLEDTVSMVESIFPGLEAERQFHGLIHNATRGNPSFIEEMLKSLVENAVIFYQNNYWQIKSGLSTQDIPVSIEEVIKRRLKNLDEETKEMIIQAAVIGEDFSVDTLKRIDNKDEGFMLELLNRAKKMRLVDELESKGNFGFTNRNIQNLLYKELNEEQRSLLHYKVAQSIAQAHKDNLYNVAGELAFHFSKAPHLDETAKLGKLASQKIAQIFEPSEIIGYLDKLTEELAAAEEEKITPAAMLSDKMWQEIIRFVRLLQGAVKNFQLYPPGVMRNNVIKELYTLLSSIYKELESISLAEVEKSLVINGKRISPKEAEQANIESFLALMIEHNLKTITFKEGTSEDELNKFVQYLSQPTVKIKEKGGWAQIIKQDAIKGIKIDDVHFVQLGVVTKEFTEKKKIEDIMLMEFLLGKVEYANLDREAVLHTITNDPKRFAQTIMDAASQAVKEGKADGKVEAIANNIEKITTHILEQDTQGDYTNELTRVISELEPALRNKVIHHQMLSKESKKKEVAENIIKATPDEVILDMVIDEYRENQNNLLVLKDFIDKILTDELRKKEILMKLSRELSKTNMDSRDFDFVSGQIKWEDLPLDRRINDIVRLPDEYYKSEIEKVKIILEELDRKRNREGLESLLYHLLVKGTELPPLIGKDLIKIVSDFVRASFFDDKIDIRQMESRLGGLLKRLNIEVDPKVFKAILDILREVIKEFAFKVQSAKNVILELEKPATKKNYLFIQQLLSILSQRFGWEKDRNPEIYRSISNFIKDISYAEFLEILVYSIVNIYYQRKSDLKGLFSLIGDELVDTLIDLESRRVSGWGDSFNEYIIRKRITDLFQELGESALNRLRQRLSQTKQDMSPSLIELVGYLKREEWIDLLLPFLRHKEPGLRRAAIRALGDIGGNRSLETISRVLKEEKNRDIIILAKKTIKKIKGTARL